MSSKNPTNFSGGSVNKELLWHLEQDQVLFKINLLWLKYPFRIMFIPRYRKQEAILQKRFDELHKKIMGAMDE